ncbi:4Fe-4S binding protein [Proteinivorax tanatarense]|uniref:4Fe-4S binding protein n=1 Tax=Proteinivorax tanatarense TaxID=1260629 RepID=A0AAU7VQG7_9FIRM
MAKGKSRVVFNEDLCKGCELCNTVCPTKIVIMDKGRINKKGYTPATVNEMDKCIGCAMCARICPDSVIEVEKEK